MTTAPQPLDESYLRKTNTTQPPDPIDELITLVWTLATSSESLLSHKAIDIDKYKENKQLAITESKKRINTLMLSRKAVEEALDKPDEDTYGNEVFWKGYDRAISDIRAALGMDK